MSMCSPIFVQGLFRKTRYQRVGNTMVDILVVIILTAILIALLCLPFTKKNRPAPVRTWLFLSIGNRLVNEGKANEAVAAYREALARHPDLAILYLALGNALARQEKNHEAVAAFRRALELAPDPGCAYDNLVSILDLTSTKRQEEGDVRAAYCRAVLLYGIDRRNHVFGSAASAAALAACGLDNVVPTLDAGERARLRQQALAWLRADVAGLRDWLETTPDKARQDVRNILQYRLQDPDFAGVRDDEALAKMPEAERQEWRALWEAIDRLRRDAIAKDTSESQVME